MSTHPESRFVRNLIAARVDGSRRYTLLNNRLTVRDDEGRSEQRLLGSGSQIRACLEKQFALRVPSGAATDERLEALSQTAS